MSDLYWSAPVWKEAMVVSGGRLIGRFVLEPADDGKLEGSMTLRYHADGHITVE